MSAPTPEDVAREIAMSAAPWLDDWRSGLERDIAAALRAARAAAIEEAARRAGQAAQDGRDNMAESKRFGVNSAGFNQDLGWTDAASGDRSRHPGARRGERGMIKGDSLDPFDPLPHLRRLSDAGGKIDARDIIGPAANALIAAGLASIKGDRDGWWIVLSKGGREALRALGEPHGVCPK